jgi:hypothetical protein
MMHLPVHRGFKPSGRECMPVYLSLVYLLILYVVKLTDSPSSEACRMSINILFSELTLGQRT